MIPSATSIAADLLAGSDTDDPVTWVRDMLGEHLWTGQANIARSVRDHRYVAVPSCYGAGKSFLAARLVAWWISTRPVGNSTVVTTAPTFSQVRAILWKEIRRAHNKGNLRGKLNQTEWLIGGDLVAFGRKPSDYDEAAFQGIHDDHVLVVFDEAAGIPPSLWDAARGLLTNPEARFLTIGNPASPASEFATACGPKSPLPWKVHKISAFDTPNFTGERVPADVARGLVSKIWVDERRLEWDADGSGSNPLWMSKVLAEFPQDDEQGVVPFSAAVACQLVELADSDVREMGVDIGGGGDQTSVWMRYGSKAVKATAFRSDDPTATAKKILRQIRIHKPTRVKIDSIGIGWGVAGRLNEYRADGAHAANVVPVNVGSRSSDPTRFPKLRDELWWDIARGLSQSRGWDLSDLDDDTLGQLTAPRWSPDASGKIKVEPKSETIKRLGRSPDDADAILLAFYAAPVVAANTEPDQPEQPSVDPYKLDRRPSILDTTN